MPDTISPDSSKNEDPARSTRARRSYPKDLKAEIVAECLRGEQSVASIALAHGINANLVHKWIRVSRTDAAPRMLAVSVDRVTSTSCERGHIELSSPGGTIRLFGEVEESSIRALLRALQ